MPLASQNANEIATCVILCPSQVGVASWLRGGTGRVGWLSQRDEKNRNVCTNDTISAVDNFIKPNHLQALCPKPGASSNNRWLPDGVDSRGLAKYRSCAGTNITETANGKLELCLSAPNGYTAQHAHLLLMFAIVRFNHNKMALHAGEQYDDAGHSQVITINHLHYDPHAFLDYYFDTIWKHNMCATILLCA